MNPSPTSDKKNELATFCWNLFPRCDDSPRPQHRPLCPHVQPAAGVHHVHEPIIKQKCHHLHVIKMVKKQIGYPGEREITLPSCAKVSGPKSLPDSLRFVAFDKLYIISQVPQPTCF